MRGYDRPFDASGDAEFIATARTALPLALDALDFAFEEISRLTSERDEARRRQGQVGDLIMRQLAMIETLRAERNYYRSMAARSTESE